MSEDLLRGDIPVGLEAASLARAGSEQLIQVSFECSGV
jgi:hypothetical protein